MKSTIEEAFAKAKQRGRCAFIPYLTGGYPDPDSCSDILKALDECGADIIEVGVPFSDPLADGPTIQRSGKIALDAGMTPQKVLDLVERVSGSLESPVVIMTYWNPILAMGPESFAEKAQKAGVAGVIVPDLPPEEAESWSDAARSAGLDTIFMAAPTTPDHRLKRIVSLTKGFLYYVSLTGVTGASLDMSDRLLGKIEKIRAMTDVPLAVGFGISTPQHAKSIASVADGVIVGSELIRRIPEDKGREDRVEAVRAYVSSMIDALSNGGSRDR